MTSIPINWGATKDSTMVGSKNSVTLLAILARNDSQLCCSFCLWSCMFRGHVPLFLHFACLIWLCFLRRLLRSVSFGCTCSRSYESQIVKQFSIHTVEGVDSRSLLLKHLTCADSAGPPSWKCSAESPPK